MGIIMKKGIYFSILLYVSCIFTSVSGESFTESFFNNNLEARLNRSDLISEFKDWPIAQENTIRTLFYNELGNSGELRRMYNYFRTTVAKTYEDGVRAGNISYQYCVDCIKCNVDLLIDLFRKSMLNSSSEVENEAIDDEPVMTQLDIVVDVPEEVELSAADDDVVFVDPEPVDPEPCYIVEEYEPILSDYEEISDSEEEYEINFHERLMNAVMVAPREWEKDEEAFENIANILVGSDPGNLIEEDNLFSLNDDLNEYLEEKISKPKAVSDYSWIETFAYNSPFDCIRNKFKKRIARQRVADEYRAWVLIALNVKSVVLGELASISIDNNDTARTRELLTERRDVLRTAQAIR